MITKFENCLKMNYVELEGGASFAVAGKGDSIQLYFQCSNGVKDWLNNFDFPAVPYRDMKDKWYAHRGFLRVWKEIEPYLEKMICDKNVKTFDVVGYSHGAAIALLCYEYIKFNRPDVDVTGVGFGCPRVFWGIARKKVKERFKGFLVIRNGNDLVTHVPPVLFGYRHICDVVSIGESEGLIKDHYPQRYKRALEDLQYKQSEEVV